MEGCVGDIRLKRGNWWARSDHLDNENPLDITYCEYCIDHNCVNVDDVYKVNLEDNLNYSINCDCPNKRNHKTDGNCIKPHVCANHRTKESGGMLMDCMMSKCKTCENDTESMGIKYCDSCSHTNKICRYCGH